ncbi:MAG: hypothetical protein AAGG75_20485 [Bacteroidota bacterium]
MEKSKLLRVLQSLDKKEWRQLQQFLQSPFFNQRQDLNSLFELLREGLKQEQSLPTKEELFRKIYPQQAFSVTNFDLLMSYLFRLVKRFLILSDLETDELQQALRLGRAYRKRGLAQDFQQTSLRLQQQLEQQPRRDASYYDLRYQLQWEQHLEQSARQPSDEAHLLEMNQTIDLSYLALKLRHACLISAHRSVYQSDSQIEFLEPVLHYVQQARLLSHPAIGIYYHCHFMLTEPDQEEHFQQFKQLLFQYGRQFPDIEIRDLYLLATNYCVRQANEGQKAYLDQLFELYKEGLEKGFLLENGILSRFTYHNAVGTGLRTGNFAWTARFIHTYKESLEKKYRESSFSFNQARLEYSQQNYSAALALLQKSNYRDLLLNLAAKALLLKIYYELGEYDLLDSHLEAMRRYIRRKRVIGYHKSNYLNIMSYTRKLLVVNPYHREEGVQLERAIQEEEVLSEKEWLLRQVNKLFP